jgi:hypothetical protein
MSGVVGWFLFVDFFMLVMRFFFFGKVMSVVLSVLSRWRRFEALGLARLPVNSHRDAYTTECSNCENSHMGKVFRFKVFDSA